MMSPQDINPWLSLVLSLIAIVGFLWNHLTSGGSKALKQVADMKEDDLKRADATVARFHLVEARVQGIEHELKHLPNLQLVHELQLALKDIQMELAKVAASADQSARTSSRVEAYLLEHGK